MKNKLIFLFTILILIFAFNISASADYNVPDRVKIGIKYGNSAPTSQSVTSQNGFIIRAHGAEEKIIGTYSSKKLKVDNNYNAGASSYLVVEQSGFGSFEDAVTYCTNNNNTTVYSCAYSLENTD